MLLGNENVHLRLAIGIRIQDAAIDRATHRKNQMGFAAPVKSNFSLSDTELTQHRIILAGMIEWHISCRAIQALQYRLVFSQSRFIDKAHLSRITINRV